MSFRAPALCITASLLVVRAAAAAEPAPLESRLLESSSLGLDADARGTAQRIVEVIRALGGHEVEVQVGHVVADVPRGEHARLLERLRKLGRVQGLTRSTEDATRQVAESEAKARAGRASRERLERLSARTVLVGEKLAIERELERVNEEIAQAEAQRRELDRRARLTRVRIRIEEPPVETIAPATLPVGWLDRLGMSHLASPPPPDTPMDRELRAFIDLSAQLGLAHVADADALDGTSKLGAAVIAFRTLGEANPVGLFGGFDLGLGYGGGFLYGVQPLFGIGVPVGTRLAFGVSTGPGISGITDRVPFGFDVPIELYVSIDAARWMSAALWARDGWVLASDERQDGSELAPFGDEASAGLLLGFGTRDERSYTDERFGPVVGFAYRELMGAKVYELRLGWGGHSSDFSY